jgi:hypothetical protein
LSVTLLNLHLNVHLIYLREMLCSKDHGASKYLFVISQTLDFYFTSPLVFKNKVNDFLSVTLLNLNLNLNFQCNLILGPRDHGSSKYLFRFSQTLDFYFTSPLVFKNKVDDFLSVTFLNLHLNVHLIYLREMLCTKDHGASRNVFSCFLRLLIFISHVHLFLKTKWTTFCPLHF